MSKGIVLAIGLILVSLVGISAAGDVANYDGAKLPETTGSTVVGSGVAEFSHQTNGDGLVRTLETEGDVTYLHTRNMDYTTSPAQSYYVMNDINDIVIDYNVAYTIECRIRINDYNGLVSADGSKIFFMTFNEPDGNTIDANGNFGKNNGGIHSFSLVGRPGANGFSVELYGQDVNDMNLPQPVVITDSNWHNIAIKVWPWDGLLVKVFDAWPNYHWEADNDYRTTTLYVDNQRSGSCTKSASGENASGSYWEFGNYNSGSAGDPNTAIVDYDVDWVKVVSLATAEPVMGAKAAFEGGPNDEMLGIFASPSTTVVAGSPDSRPLGGAGSVRMSDGNTAAFIEYWSWSGARPTWDMHYMTEENGAYYEHIDMNEAELGTGTNMYWTSYTRRLSEYDVNVAEAQFEKFFGSIDVDTEYSLEWRFRFSNFEHDDVAYDDYYNSKYWTLSIHEPGDHYAGDNDYNNTGHIWILAIFEAIDQNENPAKVLKFNRGWGSWYSGNGTTYTYTDDVNTPKEGGFIIEPNQWYNCRMVVEARASANEERVAKLYVNGEYICGGNWEDTQWFPENNTNAFDYTKIEFGNFSEAKATTIDWDLDYIRTGLYAEFPDCDLESGLMSSYDGWDLPFDTDVVEAGSGDDHWKYPAVFDTDSICLYDGSRTEFARHWNGSSELVIKELLMYDNEGMVNEVDYFHFDAMDTIHDGDNIYYSIDGANVYDVIPVWDANKGYTIGWRMRVNDYVYNDANNASIFSLQINEPDDTGLADVGGVWTVILSYDNTNSNIVAKIATSGWGDGAVIDNDWHEYKLKVYTTKPAIPGEAGTRMARLYVDGEAVYSSVNGANPETGSVISFGSPGVASGVETGIDMDLDYLRTWIDGVPTDCSGVISQGYNFAGDITKDCKVDIYDLTIMADQWLNCIVPGQSGCSEPWL